MQADRTDRLVLIDLARTAALLGMIAFHLRFDLVIFGISPPQVTATFGFYWHARLVAGAFLFLSGLSLWLAHGAGIRWPAFWRREAKLIAAAAAVSLATALAMPQSWIFFGILHSIALGSILALPFLRQPAPLTLAAGAMIMAASYHLPQIMQWNHPALRWIGLQTLPSNTMDLEPLVPWFGVLLLGVGTGKLLAPLWPRLHLRPSQTLRRLAWPGQHSLVIYLIHQPVLMALVWTYLHLI